MPDFHMALCCLSCANRVLVNMLGFEEVEAQDAERAVDGAQCALCKAPALEGRLFAGLHPEAPVQIRPGPVTIPPEMILRSPR